MKKYNYNSGWCKALTQIFLLAFGLVCASAQSTTTGAAGTDWNTTTTWTSGTLPATNNTVTVSKPITINALVVNSVGAITIASGGKITIGAAGMLNAASITIQSGGTLDMTAAGLINISGTLTNSGGTYTTGAGVINNVYCAYTFNSTYASAGGTPNVTFTSGTTGTAGVAYSAKSGSSCPTLTNTGTSYLSAAFPTSAATVPFNTTLANNKGLVTWYGTLINQSSNKSTVVSQVLASNNSNFTATTSNVGYVVSLLTGTTTTTNKVQLSSYTGGATTGSALSLTPIAIIDNFATTNGANPPIVNVKVTYNPYSQKWTLAALVTGFTNTNTVDPTLSTYTNTTTPVTDNTYTGTAMTNFGYHGNITNNSHFVDNYYITTTPIVNVTSTNSTTAPVVPLTALSGLTYVQSFGPSSNSSFYVNSASISNPVTVTVSNNTNWEISKNGSTGWGSTLTYSPASNVINSGITDGNQVFVRLKSGLSAATFASDNITISSTGIATQTVSLNGSVTNVTTPTSLTVANNTDNRQYLTWSSATTNMLVFASTSSAAIVPSGAGNGYTGANAALGSATTYSYGGNTYYLVAAGSGSNVEVTGLAIGTTYYYQVFSYDGTTYSSATAGTIANATTAVQPVTSLTATNASAQSVLAWTNPSFNATQSNYWDEVMVIASTGSITAPTGNGSGYTANAVFGSGTSDGNVGFVVYKGTATGVTVTGLTNFTNYNYAVYTRHGSVWSAASSVNAMALLTSSLTIGDFVSTATGSYSASSTWRVWDGTALQTTASTPGSTTNVWIAGGYTVTNSLIPTINAPQAPTVFIAGNSTTYANCNNLYVVNGSLIGTDGTAAQTTPTVVAATGPLNVIFVSGTAIQVGTNGKIGNTNVSPTSNGISFYLMNSGTTKIDNYASQTGGAFDAGRIAIFQNSPTTTTNPTLQIARSINLHYNGGSHGGSYALALQNAYNAGTSTTYTWTPNATITIDNGATVTMDKSCYLANYVANTSFYPVNFTLNVNGILTFTYGSGNGGTNAFNNNGLLTMGSTIANTGSAGTGCYLNIGSNGIINVPEFYPNGSNGVSGSGISASYGRNTGINIASGGQLNISAVADFSVAGGQTFTGTGSLNFTGTSTYPTPIVYLGSPTGLNAIMNGGSNSFDGAATTYAFRAPNAWAASTAYLIGQQVTSNGNIYNITTAGTSGATAPSGTGTFTDNSVTYVYINSAAQATGSSLPATVRGLNLSNASGITLSGATTVTNTLTQTSTILTAASSASVLTINSGVTLPTFSSTNYLAGPVTLYSAANTSAQTLNFPVGMNSEYLPLSLTFTQAAATATAYTVVPTVGTVTYGYANMGGVSSSRYYTLSAAGNSFTNGAITMSYTANDDDNTISLATASNIRIAQFTAGANWTNLGGTGSANVTGTITSTTAFSTLGQFAIGNQTVSLAAPTFSTASGATVSANYTIPYTLSSYNATWQNVLLNGGGSITYGGVILTKNTDYTVSASGITIIPNSGTNAAVLRTSGTITILVAAPGYTTRTISQIVSPGTATKLAITTQPAPSATLDGVLLTTSPIVVVQDVYGNTVTSSTATITATVGTGSSQYFSLGGVTSLGATTGVATFTGITAINRSATNITGFITFTSSGLTSVTSGAGVTPMTIQKPNTYYWVGTPGGVQNATAWSSSATTLWNTALNGSGTTPSGINSTDIYIVDGTNVGGTSASTVAVTLKYSGNFSVGQLRIINNAQVTLSATTSSTSTITILGANGGSSGDLYIAGGTSSLTTHSNSATAMVLQSGTSFVLASGGTFSVAIGTLTFATGSTATIGGTLNVAATGSGNASVTFATSTSATITGAVVLGSGTSNATLISVDANSINFNSGATCTLNTSSNPFGTATTTPVAGIGSVVFANGSTLTITKAFDIFAGTRKVVSFGKTSSLVNNYSIATSLLIDGNTFGNLTLNQSVNPTTPGANGFNCNNLTVNVGTFTLAQTGTVNITGNVTIATGATLNASPASAVDINLNGTSAQTVTNSGTLTLGANTTLRANNASGVSLGSGLTTLGTLNLVSGNFNVGANALTFANYMNTGGTLVTTSSSSLSYTGTGSFTLPSSITALTNLSNAGTMTIGNGSITLSGNLVNGAGSLLGSVSVSGNLTNSGTIPSTVTVAGNLVNTGTLSSNVTLNGSSVTAQSITGGNGKITNLTLNNTGSGATIVSGSQSVSGILTVSNGVLNTGSKGLILKSTSITSSAIVAPISGTGSITGTVQVERYIPNGYRGYRDIAPSVANAGSMFANWQEAGAYTSGTGIFITGEVGSSKAFNATTGIDYSASGTNPASYYNNSVSSGNWTTITTTKGTSLNPYQPYRVLVRGDRGFSMYDTLHIAGLNGNLFMVNATAIRATGNLITGNVVYSSTGVTNSIFTSSTAKLNSSSTSAFSAVANPYVCPVDLMQVSATGIEGNGSSVNKFYYFDPTFSSTGTYVTVLNGVTTPIQSKANTILQAGQSIFVRNNASTTPTITFTENAKVTNTTQTAVFGVNSINRMDFTLLRKLPTDNVYSLTDGAVAVFKASNSNGYNSNEDAAKLNNANDNISIVHSNVNLSIDGRAIATATDSIALKLGALSTKAYQLQVDGSSFTANGLTAYLYDAYLKTTTALTSGVSTYNFTVDNNTASYVNRFGVIFKPTAPLSVKAIYASATLKNEIATINWNTQGEEQVATYTVEKSIDAKNFNKVGEVVVAKNSNTASYSAIDKNIAAGNTYYRIKATNIDGSVQYSNIAQLKQATVEATYSLYPNPLKGKALTVQMNNVTAGKYTVVIYNALGQKVVNQVIVHEGGIANHAMNIGTQLSSGVYTVSILGSEGKVSETKLSVE